MSSCQNLPSCQKENNAYLAEKLLQAITLSEGKISHREKELCISALKEIYFLLSKDLRKLVVEQLCKFKNNNEWLYSEIISDEFDLAQILLSSSIIIDDVLIMKMLKSKQQDYLRLLIKNRSFSKIILYELVLYNDHGIICSILEDLQNNFSKGTIQLIVKEVEISERLSVCLIKRPEFNFQHAMEFFWRCQSKFRKELILKFSLERNAILLQFEELYKKFLGSEEITPAKNIMKLFERRQRPRFTHEQLDITKLFFNLITQQEVKYSVAEIANYCNVDEYFLQKILFEKNSEALMVLLKSLRVDKDEVLYFICKLINQGVWKSFLSQGEQNKGTLPQEVLYALYEKIPSQTASTIIYYWNWFLKNQSVRQNLS